MPRNNDDAEQIPDDVLGWHDGRGKLDGRGVC